MENNNLTKLTLRPGRLAVALALAGVLLATGPAAPAAPVATAAPDGRWPRCYVSGNWRTRVCYCGRTRYPMYFCTRRTR